MQMTFKQINEWLKGPSLEEIKARLTTAVQPPIHISGLTNVIKALESGQGVRFHMEPMDTDPPTYYVEFNPGDAYAWEIDTEFDYWLVKCILRKDHAYRNTDPTAPAPRQMVGFITTIDQHLQNKMAPGNTEPKENNMQTSEEKLLKLAAGPDIEEILKSAATTMPAEELAELENGANLLAAFDDVDDVIIGHIDDDIVTAQIILIAVVGNNSAELSPVTLFVDNPYEADLLRSFIRTRLTREYRHGSPGLIQVINSGARILERINSIYPTEVESTVDTPIDKEIKSTVNTGVSMVLRGPSHQEILDTLIATNGKEKTLGLKEELEKAYSLTNLVEGMVKVPTNLHHDWLKATLRKAHEDNTMSANDIMRIYQKMETKTQLGGLVAFEPSVPAEETPVGPTVLEVLAGPDEPTVYAAIVTDLLNNVRNGDQDGRDTMSNFHHQITGLEHKYTWSKCHSTPELDIPDDNHFDLFKAQLRATLPTDATVSQAEDLIQKGKKALEETERRKVDKLNHRELTVELTNIFVGGQTCLKQAETVKQQLDLMGHVIRDLTALKNKYT